MDSPEYKTLIQCWPPLVNSIHNSPAFTPEQLRQFLFLTKADYNLGDSPRTISQMRAKQIVDRVLTKVKIDSQVYHTFVEALKTSGSWATKVVSALEDTYSAIVQSPAAELSLSTKPGEVFRVQVSHTLMVFTWVS